MKVFLTNTYTTRNTVYALKNHVFLFHGILDIQNLIDTNGSKGYFVSQDHCCALIWKDNLVVVSQKGNDRKEREGRIFFLSNKIENWNELQIHIPGP